MTRDDRPVPPAEGAEFSLPRGIAPPHGAWAKIAARLERREDADIPAALLPADVTPPADLWPAIAARLAGVRSPRRGRAAIAAAAAAALAAVVFVGTRIYDAQPRGDISGSSAAANPMPSTSLGASWMLQEPTVSDDVAATMRHELALVHDERLRIERAMVGEPDNSALRELWAYTYEVELDLADAWTRTVMAYQIG